MTRRLARGAIMAATLMFSCPALAAQYGLCILVDGPTSYSSGIVELADGVEAANAFREGAFSHRFAQYVAQRYGARTSAATHCYVYASPADATTMRETRQDGIRILVEWNGEAEEMPYRPGAGAPAPADGGAADPTSNEGQIPVDASPSAPSVGAAPPVESGKEAVVNEADAAAAAQAAAIAAAQHARVEAMNRSANARSIADFEDWQAAQREAEMRHEEAVARHRADVAEWEAERAREQADWRRRVAACVGGDRSQCADPNAPDMTSAP